MKKTVTKPTALFTVIVLLVSLFSAFALPLSAQAPLPDDFDPGVSLDYAALRDRAYIVNSEWTELSGKLSYTFRSKTYTETYSASRHFNSWSAAYNAYLNSGDTRQTPVFIINGTLSGDINLSSSAVILGANAGISPNAALDLETTDPTAGWTAAQRGTETCISGTFILSGPQTDEYELVFDGLLFNGAAAAYKKTDSANPVQADVNITAQYITVNLNAPSAFMFDDRNSKSVHTYEFNDIRVESSAFQAILDYKAVKTHINNMCFTDNSGGIIRGVVESEKFDFDMRKSYIYNNSIGYTINVNYTEEDHHVSNIDVHNNIFYNSNAGEYGFMIFCSTANSSKSSYDVNVRGNTIVSTNNNSYTLFNGSYTYQKGSYTLNCNYNRVIGYKSMFPNVSEETIGWEGYNMIKADFNYNYFNDSYTSHDDVIDERTWTRSDYGIEHPYIDPFDSEKIIYYKDYRLTVYDGMLDITGADFYDDVEYMNIDNDNNEVAFGLAKGVTVSGLSLDYGFNFAAAPDSVLYYRTEKVNGTNVKIPLTSFSAPAADTFDMYFADVTRGNVTETYLITVYGESTTPSQSFIGNFTDPTGEINKTAYLYVSGLSETTYTISLNGSRYSFTANYNAFDSLAKIFAKAAADRVAVPQIILADGNYGTLNITGSCEIYGCNYLTPAASGTGADTRRTGSSWSVPMRTNVTAVKITGGGKVKISGITLNGNITDTSRTSAADITVKNSIINGSIDLSNQSVKTDAKNSLTVSGVWVQNGNGAFIKNQMPASVTLSNVYAQNGVTKIFDTGWSQSLASSLCKLTVDGCRFDNVGNSFIVSPTGTAAFSNAGLSVTGSAFYAYDGIALLIDIDPSLYAAEFTDNAFINAGDNTTCTLISAQPSVFTRNRIISFIPGITADCNYLADYTPSFKTAAMGKAYGNLYYMDYALTILNTDYGIDHIRTGSSGAVRAQFSDTFKTVQITLGSGNAAGVEIIMKGGAQASVYSDPACTVPADLSSAVFGSVTYFYAKSPASGSTDCYRVVIDSEDPQTVFADGFEDDTIKPSALIIDPSFAGCTNGDIVYTTWQGRNWSFVKGINAFASLADAFNFADDNGIRMPQVLVTSFSGSLNITRAANIYSQNYNTVPYLRTDSFDGSDWTYNPAYDEYKTTVADIAVGAAASGNIGVYGFEMTGGYIDNKRPRGSKCSVHLENILINSKNAPTMLFNQNGNSVRTSAEIPNNENTDKLIVKNTYIQSCISTRLMYEWHTQTVEFDGLFMDCTTYPVASTNYVKQAGDNTKLIFRNCNLRSLSPDNNLFQFEGNRSVVLNGQTREIIMENNIFYNFMFSTNGFFPLYPANFSAFTMLGNRLINTTGSKNLIHSFSNGKSSVPLTVTLKDNIFYGFNAAASVGTNQVNADASVISGNYTAPAYTIDAQGHSFSVTAGNTTLTSTDYLPVNPLKPSAADFALQTVTGPGRVTVDGTSVTAELVSAVLSDITFTYASPDIVSVVYTDAACTLTADTSAAANGTYYVRGMFTASNGMQFFADTVYTLKVTGVNYTKPLFHSSFTDSLIPKTALLVDKNCAAASALYETTWDGAAYAFIKNVNVFATLAAAVEYAESNGISDPHFMLKDIDGYSGNSMITDFFVPCPGSYYTQNYNKMPYIRGTAADGSDWRSNIGTGSGKFDTAKGVTVSWLNFNRMTSGSYKLYGFTLRSVIQDNTRPSDVEIDVFIQNTYFRSTHSSYPIILTAGSRFTTDNSASRDKVVIKDMYYVEQSTNCMFNSGSPSLWATTVFDGLFADFKGSTYTVKKNTVENNARISETVFRNCNLRNLIPATEHISFNGHNTVSSVSGDKKLVLENNIFYNYHFYNADTFLYAKLSCYSELTVTNNRIYSPSGTAELIGTSQSGGDGIPESCKLTVTDNFLNGIDSTVYVDDRALDPASVIEHNYLTPEYSADSAAKGTRLDSVDSAGKISTGGVYYLDAAMTVLSNEISAMTLDGESFESEASVTVPAKSSTANILSFINAGFNTVSFYSDSDMTLEIDPEKITLGSLGTTVYVLVESDDRTVSEIRTVHILREEGYFVSNTGLGSTSDREQDGVTYNWLSWRGEVTASGVTVSGIAEGQRVGVIYLNDSTNLAAVKADMKAAFTDLDIIETAVGQINAKYYDSTKDIKVYYFQKGRTFTWDNKTQSYGYRYNFSVQEGWYRGVVMYVAYEDANGNVCIDFSDIVVQQS